jgi:hypothetical protein
MAGQLNKRPPVQHYPHITVEQLPDMLRRLANLKSVPTVLAVR